MPTDWHALAATVDNACDDAFGVQCKTTPWIKNLDKPDVQRAPSEFVGIYVSPKASEQATGSGFDTMAANSEIVFSVRRAYIGNVRQHDRAQVIDPMIGGMYEIVFIDPGDTDRAEMRLLRLKGVTP